MSKAFAFQSVIMSLQKFWADQGCLIWQPYYSQVGAGTMNPATFLRVLGPEPWKVAYVEPSIRPDDGRYGENPNRFQQHYQFQVILKPDPGNPQEIYLESLKAIGIDPREHDIRFVEDNWQQPALGAWGLGWEVWLDGQEITQFTYFQQAGGLMLDPVSVEITYGLERITMPLQRVHHFREMRWNDTLTDGDVNLQAEVEHSKYYFEVADVERMRQLYQLYQAEAAEALGKGLVLPAYDYLLKCSHTFNILDTRGAMGVTERQAMFGKMREMARAISEAYVAQRQELGFPWMRGEKKTSAVEVKPIETHVFPDAPTDLLLEIGTEELPVADLQSAIEQLIERVPLMLDELRLTHGQVSVAGTPRRLVVIVEDLAARQEAKETLVKGPPASRGYDANGLPTKAAEGFAQSKGVRVQDLRAREIDGGTYLVALVKEDTRPTHQVLGEALPGLLESIKFEKTMRWNHTNVPFSRPVRWLTALLGGSTIPFEFAGLRATNTTHGLRFNEPTEITLTSLADYQAFLSSQGIILDPLRRKKTIQQQVNERCEQVGGRPLLEEELLEEVSRLVEAPTALLGRFDPAHLELPPEVLISVMKKHQRYFPVCNDAGKLLPFFVVVRNGDGHGADVVTDGNEQVIKARFADAQFFIKEDMKHKLEDMLVRLGSLTFQHKLGSMLDKSRRVTLLADPLSGALGLSAAEKLTALRAAELCKADLVTHMVVEMTSLQGIMGQYYALHSGETQAVADAIREHYLPRYTGDSLPGSKAGLVVGLADRLDSLVGLFGAGLAPTGTRDPFAQRRTAIGLVQLLTAFDIEFDLRQWLELAAQNLPLTISVENMQTCADFITARLRNILIEQGARYDVVDAVLAEQANNPASAQRGVKELGNWVEREDWNSILPAYARCVRITRDQKQIYPVNPAAFADPTEEALHEALVKAEQTPRRAGSVRDSLNVFLPMIPAVNAFFDSVLVMAEGPGLRTNRLGLLQRVSAIMRGVADLSKLEGF
ncbi:MAG TPA: glycine--tRNA ligase subunit beta [Anaerolineaceae bacterium]|jgi:glycyl-tRNA synthetase|nr:glycine--tRNA ligase subunit beta [Chloroflexota bacterium]HNS07776.1 glycine--tRNA ligase subunit beta [Anaerolineaceae bacterium]HOE01525.1 glycine--tRNA ligase subunit beta [Anaerolineaceae bacterium]HPD62403.1 glycine--tRNA ligase subunit beta [Anaerolineaceae bacterium]HRT91955.1 glycine--tRNA ligase subunit beta [Anaerolineaceae bacterium]